MFRTAFAGALVGAALVFAPLQARADAAWDELVKKAEAEGEVNVKGGPGRFYALALSEAFAKTYPKVKINYDGGPSREFLPKIIREAQSGIHSWDVFIGGAPSVFQTLTPAKLLADLKPNLVLPEVLDDKAWRGGFDLGWMDKEKRTSFGFDMTEESTVYVNWDFVKPDDLKTVQDLMSPKFAGKIVSHDPRLQGEGLFTFQAFYYNLGEQFVRDMMAKQKILFTDQRRQAAEWLVRGQYPIAFATPVEDLRFFQQQGIGKNVKVFKVGITKQAAGVGFGMISMFKDSPHPNAGKLYANWLLSKDGQENWKQVARNSRRLDVTLADPEFAPDASKPIINYQSEDQVEIREKIIALGKELIPTEAGK
jgi:iron(III) transport system substrate-binding protein